MILYAESSAVLSWLLGENDGETVRRSLADAEVVVTSELTLVECDRTLHRGHVLGHLSPAWVAELRAARRQVAQRWLVIRLTRKIVERARRPLPEEPIRSLDALHLASALETAELAPGIRLLSLDERVRRSGEALGFELLPSAP